jgi:glycerol-3-phosphate acyltransferase PlsY
MDAGLAIACAIVGYLVGSVSFARIVSAIAAPGAPVPDAVHLRLEGSDQTLEMRTVSATTVSVRLGSRYGFLTYVLDMLKVAVPVAICRAVLPGTPYSLVLATAAIVGHIWPVYHGFKGGRGLSAIYGTLLVVDWIGVLVTSVAGMLFGLLVVRSVAVAYLAGVWFIAPWLWFRTGEIAHLVFALIVNVLFAIASLPELRAYERIRREDRWNDPAAVIQLSGMGRGLVKMARRLGIGGPRGS